jgi:hypothetical protein
VKEDGDHYVVTRGTSKLRIPKAMVERIEARVPALTIYETKLRETDPNSPDALCELAAWCRKENLRAQSTELLRKVIDINPDHEGARKLLGYRQIGGGWYVTCTKCRGAKRVACPACADRSKLRDPCERGDCDRGRVRCTDCNGDRSKTCGQCGARGWHPCHDCNESGKVNDDRDPPRLVNCPKCRGRGRLDCPGCRAGRIACRTCRARGWLPCTGCSGRGFNYRTCPECEDTRKQPCPACEGLGALPEDHALIVGPEKKDDDAD